MRNRILSMIIPILLAGCAMSVGEEIAADGPVTSTDWELAFEQDMSKADLVNALKGIRSINGVNLLLQETTIDL